MKEKEDTNYSPVGVLEDYFKSSDSESSSSKEPNLDSEGQKSSKSASLWHGFLQLLKTKSKKSLATMHPLSVMKLSKRMSSSMREVITPKLDSDIGFDHFNSPWKSFTLYELQAATNFFSRGMLQCCVIVCT